MQTILVFIIIAYAGWYAGRRIYKAIRSKDDPCHGCKGCAIRDRISRQRDCSKTAGKTLPHRKA